jgi:hypothetical protein
VDGPVEFLNYKGGINNNECGLPVCQEWVDMAATVRDG